ncbi:tetraacyldisaccharide 4'-kinase [Candidatus Thalassolituus haligoni]|uniref:tetraacyldisaccharide 4'-kinase n=1 Tax=Candidatus Thalassolituus haligoni TaxID=3100113 RepID=UPI0035187041|tara:strand:+ start:6622 stop:7614 length:993 start_codon:yes stop_codon:yes gene_type:complete
MPVAGKKPTRLASWIEQHWYRSPIFNAWLLPLQWLFWLLVMSRRIFYALFPPAAVAVPVIVVGNISVGGTGKTPLIVWLANRARELNMRVGIVSRGYGGSAEHYPLEVTQDTPADVCGDEPLLLFERLGCPVVVDPKRRRAVEYLADKVDLVLSDDGLQHYAMPRVAELVIVDGKRGFGNGWLLPIGPLREPQTRLDSVDRVIVNGKDFVLQPLAMINAVTAERADLLTLDAGEVHAVAGIGSPERFFGTLRQLGMTPIEHPFADHHPFTPEDLMFGDDKPVVMTEKDWVKCRSFVNKNCWYLPVDAVPNRATRLALDTLLTTWGEKYHG